MRRPHELPIQTAEELEGLDTLYRTARDVRLRTRAQIVLLAGDQRLTAPPIAAIVRESDQAVRNWLKRYRAAGIEGLRIAPCQGRPPRSHLPTKSSCARWCGNGHGVWDNPTPSGHCNAWRT